MKQRLFSFSLLFPTTSIIFLIFFIVSLSFWIRPSSLPLNLQDSIHTTLDAVSPTVVIIVGNEGISGAGVIIDEQGTILTSKHLVRMGERVGIRLPNQKIAWAHPIALHPTLDLALIALENREKTYPIPLINSQAFLRSGDLVIAFGVLPESRSFVSHLGTLSGMDQSLQVGHQTFHGLLLTDIPFQAGYSGGPLVNLRGELIGIHSVYETGGHIGWSVPVDANLLHDWRLSLQ